MRYEGAELVIYFENGVIYDIPLNELQLAIVMKILGISIEDDGYTQFQEQTLKSFIESDTNPLKRVFVEVKEEQ